MTDILDTQIISYAHRGEYSSSTVGKRISSITANEFLLVQSADSTKANYYPPLLSQRHYSNLNSVARAHFRDHPFHKIMTDQVLMDFGTDFPAVIEFGGLAISNIINERNNTLFNEAIKHLEKNKIKVLRKRFAFLMDQDIKCVPLSFQMLTTGASLLEKYSRTHNLKDNFRNSLNDILIFSCAICLSTTLITKDKELNKFIIAHYEATCMQRNDISVISFENLGTTTKMKSLNSKGYINKGWRIHQSRKVNI